MNNNPKKLSLVQHEELLAALKEQFAQNMPRHQGLAWANVEAKLEANPAKLWPLHEMERTRGEPDVVGYATAVYTFYDCAEQSPTSGRFSA